MISKDKIGYGDQDITYELRQEQTTPDQKAVNTTHYRTKENMWPIYITARLCNLFIYVYYMLVNMYCLIRKKKTFVRL